MSSDPNDREFKIMIINAFNILLFEEDMNESEWYRRRENLKKQLEELYMKEAYRDE